MILSDYGLCGGSSSLPAFKHLGQRTAVPQNAPEMNETLERRAKSPGKEEEAGTKEEQTVAGRKQQN